VTAWHIFLALTVVVFFFCSETVSQARSWFDKLTTHGPRHFKNQVVSRSP